MNSFRENIKSRAYCSAWIDAVEIATDVWYYDINKKFDPYFISVLLKTPIAMKEFFLASEQGASIVRRNLNMNLFENIAFQIPSLDKQKDIATRLNKLQKNLDMHVKALDFLNKFKRGLLQQMFI